MNSGSDRETSRQRGALLALLYCLLVAAAWQLSGNPFAALVLALAPAGLVVVVSGHFWFVLLFILFSFFRIHEVIPQLYSFKIPLLLSVAALGGIMWHLLISRKLVPYWHPSLAWLLLFWGLVIIGIVFASNRGIAIGNFKGIYWKIIVMSLAVMYIVNSARQLNAVSVLITLSGLLVGVVALFNSINGVGLVEGSRVTIGRNIGSMLGDPNDLALVLMFPFAFSISVLLTPGSHSLYKSLCLAICIILLLAVIATQSRGGLLGVLAVSGVYALRYIRSKSLLLLMAAGGALLLYLASGISDRASGGGAEEGIDASAMGRLYAWEAALRMALDNPLTGVGLNNFYFNYFYYSSHWDGLNHAVHSTWFGVLAETGILGLVVFVCCIISLLKTARSTIALIESKPEQFAAPVRVIAYAVYAGLIGTVVSGTFLTQGFNWPIYLLAALIISVAQIASQIDKQQQEKK
jgi:probable O-glycosylation ligase (exosortase A-associated)